jgi:hypothetical protein
MTAVRCNLRLPSIVLAAILGILPMAGEAAACSAQGAGAKMGSCCAASSRSACCCAAETAATAQRAIERNALGLAGGSEHQLATDSSCQCRPSAPTDPAPKPRSSTSERRTDQGRVWSWESNGECRPATIFVSLVPPTESPRGAPLYLRASRLLI